MLLYIVKYMYWLHTGPKFISYFPGEAGFFVIGRYMTPVPPILKKVIFFRFLKKNHLFQQKKLYFLFSNSKVYIMISQTKKIQALLMNFTGISAKRRKGQTKSEKNKVKKEHFSCTLFEWFFKKLYFSHRGNISKIMGKIQLLQKKVGFSTRKMFLFFFSKTEKMEFYTTLR